MTNYRQAWLDYRKTEDFKSSDDELKAKGIRPQFRKNILMCAFAAGWNATGKKITRIRKSKK